MSQESPTILLIANSFQERERLIYELLQESRYAYTILEAGTGNRGLEQCRRVQLDAIVLDDGLPDGDGLEFLDALQRQANGAEIPVVLLIAPEQEAAVAQVFTQAARHYLIKPLMTGDTLRLAVDSVLRQGELLRQCATLQAQSSPPLLPPTEQFPMALERRIAERTTELAEFSDRLVGILNNQRQTQLMLQEQAQLLDLAHDTIMTLDLDWAITFWNQGAELMYGWSRGEALGRISHTLLKTEFPQPLADITRTLMKEGYWEGELIHYSRDNRQIIVSSRWVLQTNTLGQPLKILEINNDITQRKQSEIAILEAEHRWRSLFEHAPLAIVSLDTEARVTAANPYLLRLIGYPHEEVIGQNWFTLVMPDQTQEYQQQFQQTLCQDIPAPAQSTILTRFGETRILKWTHTLLRDTHQQLIGMTSIGEDVTERQAVEKLKDEFISIVSHELRTPLTSIRGALGLLATGVMDDDLPATKHMIDIAAADTERLVRLVNDILDLEKLETGKISLVQEWCNAADLMERSLSIMTGYAQEVGVKLTLKTIPAQLWVAPDQIIQVFTNLLSNAIKFSHPDGTVALSADIPANLPQPNPVTTPAATNNPKVRFAVSDQGRGIPADKLDSIFGRFQQVDASDSHDKGGTGLGLAICKSIVQQHAGQIWVESTWGQGSTFYFTLPLYPESNSKL